ncbi:MAG: SpoIIE family protein phosphatase [Anaerolineae bacterium]|nr:SpoIIE family protein phosphatase [Anaerolineae bacterium]
MTANPGRILVVDDHKTNRLKISMAVKRLGHTPILAENGRIALDILQNQPVDLVLLDIIMPEIDGYQVLAEMKSRSELRDIPVIVISAQEELLSIIKAIELGAEDYLPKTFDPILLKARIGACLEKKRLRDQQAATLAQLDTENKRKSAELESARQIQRSMLPLATPSLPYLDIVAWQETASEVGGDYYDFFTRVGDKQLLVLGDATGHGVSSALMVSMTKALLLAHRSHDIKSLLEELNVILCKLGLGKQLNMALLLLELQEKPDGGLAVTVSGGGIPPIYILRPAASLTEVLISGLPLGITPEAVYQVTSFELGPGDVIILMSDGVVEQFNAFGQFLGFNRLYQALQQLDPSEASANIILEHIKQLGKDWAGGHPLHDDVTVVVAKVL